MNKSNLVLKHFSQAANSYDKVAYLQRITGDKLLGQLNTSPKQILDLGAGTGYCSTLLSQKFPDSKILSLDLSPSMLEQIPLDENITPVQSDMNALPIINNSLDLVLANMSLQWSPNLLNTLTGIYQSLSSQGDCLFSLPGPQTLSELRTSWEQVDAFDHTNRFYSETELHQNLSEVGFKSIQLTSKIYHLEFQTLLELMQYLKALGANTILNNQQKTLMGRLKLRKLTEFYETYRNSGSKLPCTYEIIYVKASKENS